VYLNFKYCNVEEKRTNKSIRVRNRLKNTTCSNECTVKKKYYIYVLVCIIQCSAHHAYTLCEEKDMKRT